MEMTNEMKQKVNMLIRWYNMNTGFVYKFGTEKNQRAAIALLDATNGELQTARAHLKECATKRMAFTDACYSYVAEPIAEPKAEPAEQKLDSSLDFMSKLIVEMLAKTKLDDIQGAVIGKAEDAIKQFIADNYGPIQRKIEVQVGNRKTELEGVLHSEFETVLQFVSADVPVFLAGPAGSGKNVICKQVAKALGLDFYFSNAVTQEYKITGFTDAMGHFQESQFYKAFKNGGVFMLDEIDASIPEVLVILNAAIANRYFDFPAPIGYVEAHPDFRVIAAGNTFGEGADSAYVGRNQLDAASLNRFATVIIDYDSRIEESCANGDGDLLNFCRAFRKAINRAGVNAVVSYRNISMMAKMVPAIGVEKALRTCLVKSLDKNDLSVMRADLGGCGKYSAAYESILRSM